MRLAHDAIARHRQVSTMLYISIDQASSALGCPAVAPAAALCLLQVDCMHIWLQIWERPRGPCPPLPDGFQHCHLGSMNVVRGMWQRLGIDMDWSLAIHPYGNPLQARPLLPVLAMHADATARSKPALHDFDSPREQQCLTSRAALQKSWPASFHFVDVDRIAQFQIGMLHSLGVAQPQRWPQAMVAATEQGWLVRALHAASTPLTCRARKICLNSSTDCAELAARQTITVVSCS